MVISLADELSCHEVRELNDDVYHYDSMVGFDCTEQDGSWTAVRAYQDESSVGQVLQDWQSQLDDDFNALVGKNWFALGSPQHLAEIERLLELPAAHGTAVPSPVPLTRQQEALRACTVGVVSIVRNIIFETPDPDMADSYESVFPGSLAESEEAATELDATSIRSEADFEYAITDVGPEIKSFCATTIE
ncbi:hypothetical protein [Microbacterium sp. BLY]|uniref:hypothetical protein n=1 Tax=Microbacterium sp. BLY TaxID=2823280 RepID=UPI001B3212B0|nr:hypothetical protein [Microbacterium sp. BLY]MBP3977006.1 hypothetical protein [Microbacterium sp. BLY]